MTCLQQLLAHTLILTMGIGGVACLCPAEAADPSAADTLHGVHGHAGGLHAGGPHADGAPGAGEAGGCGHESCGVDCTRVSAVSAKSKATIPGKALPSLDDIDDPDAPLPAFGPVPATTPPAGRLSAPRQQALLPGDSPVRRFDRLLD